MGANQRKDEESTRANARPSKKHGDDQTDLGVDPSMIFDLLPAEMQPLVEEARRAIQQGDMESAMAMLQSLIAGDPADQGGAEIEWGDEEDESISEFPLCNLEAQEVLEDYFDSDDESDEGLVTACQEALRLDPHAVDALVLLGESTDSVEDRVDYFRRASEAARHQDAELVPEFMPGVRLDMATDLVDVGRLADAAEILAPALDEDPADRLGTRWALTDYMLRLGWDEDLESSLDDFKEEQVGTTPYARALLAFRRSGASDEANHLLRRANECNPYVYPLLSGLQPLSAHLPERIVAGGQDEASMIAHFLLSGWRSTPDAMGWIRDTLANSEHAIDKEARSGKDLMQRAAELPPGKEDWFFYTIKVNPDETIVLIRDSGERLVALEPFEQKPKADQLRNFFYEAIAEPFSGPPRKPKRLYVPTKGLLGTFGRACNALDLVCEQRKPPKEEKEMAAKLGAMANQQRLAAEGDNGADVETLPQLEETWIYGLFHPPIWIGDEATPRRGWVQLLVDASAGFVLGTDVTDAQPSPAEMVRFLGQSMARPAMGDARRPSQLLFDPERSEAIATAMPAEWHIAAGKLENAEIFTEIIRDMIGHSSAMQGSLMGVDGIGPGMLARFYETCALFYRAAPWRMVPGDALIDLTCRGWSNETWTACIIGQMGQELGVSLFEDPQLARRSIETQDVDIDQLRCIATHFDEAFKVNPADVWDLERYGWALASPEAYPFVARFEPGGTLTMPSAEELQVLEITLSHLPRFLDLPRGEELVIEQPHPDQSESVTLRWVE